jgi:hypothetical protein
MAQKLWGYLDRTFNKTVTKDPLDLWFRYEELKSLESHNPIHIRIIGGQNNDNLIE